MSTLRLTMVCSAVTICDADDDRIDAAPRHRAVRLASLDDDLERVRSGHERAAAIGEVSGRDVGEDVQAEDGLDLRVLPARLPSTISSAPAGRSFAGAPSSAGWKMNFTVPGSRSWTRVRMRGGRQQDGHVRVVPAGVHHADVLPVVLGRGLAGERHVDLLANRQPVHVGAQRDHRAWPAALQNGDDAGAGDGRLRFESEGLEAIGDVLRGLQLAVGELGPLVEIPAPLQQFGLDGGGELVDLGRERRCSCRFRALGLD